MVADAGRAFILLQPEAPWGHQGEGSAAVLLAQVQHAAGPAAAGTALGIGTDRLLVIEEGDRLVQHGFREAQLGMGLAQLLHQGGGIAVGFEQAIQHPADRQLQAEMQQRRLVEEVVNGLQALASLAGAGGAHGRCGKVLPFW